MNKTSLTAKQFSTIVVAGVAVLTGFFVGYSFYEAPQRYVQDLISENENHKQFQDNLQSSITSGLRSTVLQDSKLVLAEAKSIGEANMAKNTSLASSKLVTPYAGSEHLIAANNSEVQSIASQGTNQQVTEYESDSYTDLPVLKERNSDSPLFLKMRALSFGLKSSPILAVSPIEPSEFSSKRINLRAQKYLGLTGGYDQYVQHRDYSSVIEQQIEKHYENLENTNERVKYTLFRSEFNLAAVGGVRLWNRVDVETGITFRNTTERFRSVYENLIRKEFVYIEWVPTGEFDESSNSIEYAQRQTSDIHYQVKADTIETTAKNYGIEVPLVFRYNWKFKNKFGVFAAAGANARLFEFTSVRSNNLSQTEVYETKHDQFGLVHLQGILSAGITYQIADGLELRFEPQFRPELINNTKLVPGVNLNSRSVNLGATYKF